MSSTAKRFYERAEVSSVSRARIPEPQKRNTRILVVEDEPGIADAYRDILAPKEENNVIPLSRSSRIASNAVEPSADLPLEDEFELTVVHDAEQAIAEVKHAIAKGRPFTMGFFDVLLGPGMDGIELVKKIYEIDPRIYAVFVTAYSDRSVDSIQTLLGEAKTARWDYLNKPFSRGEILQKARNGVALWNLEREKEIKEEHVANLQNQLREHERYAIMALVARGIGHEFRNIMTTIIGKATLAANLNTPEQLKESVKTILQASHRAKEILERFKYLKDPNAQVIEKKSIPVHAPIEEAIALLGHELQDKHIRICWIRKKNVNIQGNATALVQVYMNLLLNAVQAMGDSGQVDLSIVDIGDRVEVRVRDFGPGLDPKLIDKVTAPFFTTKRGGTGLGLAIVKDIVEIEHGGTLVLSNHQSKGLEVILTFPIDKGAPVNGETNEGTV